MHGARKHFPGHGHSLFYLRDETIHGKIKMQIMERNLKWREGKQALKKHSWKNNILGQFLLFGMVLIILLAATFTMSNGISRRILADHSQRSGEQIILQMKKYLDDFNENVENIFMNLGYSPTIVQYFKGGVPEQILLQNDVLVVLGNTQLLLDDIMGMGLYDEKGELLIDYGEYWAEAWQEDEERESGAVLQYSGLSVAKDGSKFCTVSMPVYDMKSWSYQKQIGTCVILLDVAGFESMLDQMLLTENSEMVITDRESQVVAYIGKRQEPPLVYKIEGMEGNNDYIVNETKAEGMDWRVASIIPKRDLQEQFNYLQSMNIVTCLMVILLLLLFGIFCYRNILRPVKMLASFVHNHLKQPQERISLHAASEIEGLAGQLNCMLDEQKANSQRIQEMQKQVYQMEILQKQAELLAYQSQIKPHFLYNTLDCIQSMAYEYGADPVAEVILDLSKMFRYSIAGDGMVLLRQELAYIRQYAAIIRCRFMGRINVEIEAAEEILDVKMPKLLLQPLVENGIFHGLERCSRNGTVQVIAKSEEAGIVIEISDNGHGMTEQELAGLRRRLKDSKQMEPKSKEGSGVGMVNIYQRLKILYGGQAVFWVESRLEEGTRITLKLPIEWEGQKDV